MSCSKCKIYIFCIFKISWYSFHFWNSLKSLQFENASKHHASHDQRLSFHAKFGDDAEASAQNVLLQITLAGTTYNKEKDEDWNGSYYLKKGNKMLQHSDIKKKKNQKKVKK